MASPIARCLFKEPDPAHLRRDLGLPAGARGRAGALWGGGRHHRAREVTGWRPCHWCCTRALAADGATRPGPAHARVLRGGHLQGQPRGHGRNERRAQVGLLVRGGACLQWSEGARGGLGRELQCDSGEGKVADQRSCPPLHLVHLLSPAEPLPIHVPVLLARCRSTNGMGWYREDAAQSRVLGEGLGKADGNHPFSCAGLPRRWLVVCRREASEASRARRRTHAAVPLPKPPEVAGP
mmetsp:Transcript_65789/g.132116  ORF Transcript_65789/g.132116 Transcript_65789/m.132116 type:complete len:238 (+) Transcript_65789:1109-1822(+)